MGIFDGRTLEKLQGVRMDLLRQYKDVSTEAEALQERANDLLRQIHALNELLKQEDKASVEEEPTAEREEEAAESNKNGHMGLRDSIRWVLQSNPQGLRPAEITRVLEARNFPKAGKTELSARVGNELWRMAKRGLLSKTKRSKYKLKPPDTSG